MFSEDSKLKLHTHWTDLDKNFNIIKKRKWTTLDIKKGNTNAKEKYTVEKYLRKL